MSKKVIDVDNDLAQFKADTGERITRIEQAIETLRDEAQQRQSDAEKKHSEMMLKHSELMSQQHEMMKILMGLVKTPTPPVSQPPQNQPPPEVSVGPPPLPPPPFPIATTVIAPPLAPPPFLLTSTTPPPTLGFSLTTVPPPLIATIPLCLGEDRWSSIGGENSRTRGSFHEPRGYEFVSQPYNVTGTAAWDGRYGPTGDRIWVPGADHRLRKLKMPLFNGEDAYGWVFQAERFFEMQGFITSAERLRAAVSCLEGQALSWYCWINRREPFRCWEQLKLKILARFQPSQSGNLHEQLITVSQTGTAREYVSQFETLAAQFDGVSEPVLEGAFIKGLKPELQESVRVLQPRGVGQAIHLALMIDESRSSNMEGTTLQSGPTTTTVLLRPIGVAPRVPIPPPPKPYEPDPTTPEFRRMTETEYADKRAKGLCVRCDAKYMPGHRCSGKTLKVIMIREGDLDENYENWAERDEPP